MKGYLMIQGIYFLRILIAALCGILIGYERQNRLKVAGVRTHLIVSLAAAMIMIVSKYGFNDILSHNGIALDPSRIAAQIISGVSFLGAGIIFVHKREITGLTTAAGIWATAAVGMAIGAGMYIIGVLATILILLVQIIFHRQYRWIPTVNSEMINLEVKDISGVVARTKELMKSYDIEVIKFKATRNTETITIEMFVKLPKTLTISDLLSLLDLDEDILSIEAT